MCVCACVPISVWNCRLLQKTLFDSPSSLNVFQSRAGQHTGQQSNNHNVPYVSTNVQNRLNSQKQEISLQDQPKAPHLTLTYNQWLSKNTYIQHSATYVRSSNIAQTWLNNALLRCRHSSLQVWCPNRGKADIAAFFFFFFLQFYGLDSQPQYYAYAVKRESLPVSENLALQSLLSPSSERPDGGQLHDSYFRISRALQLAMPVLHGVRWPADLYSG